MKRAIILHGTSGDPSHNWQPWLKKQLEDLGYEVFSPLLPDNDVPNQATYEKFLRDSGWDFTDNVVIGHSSGATAILNLLQSDWFPKAKCVVLVAAFLNEKWTKELFPNDDFKSLFVTGYDPVRLKEKAEAFYFVHGNNDPYCDIEDARQLCKAVHGTFIVIPGGHHLGDTYGKKELPGLLERLSKDRIL